MPHYRFLLLASALASPAFAQAASDEVIVTAVRTPTPVNQVASSVTVLDKGAIDASQQFIVSDLIVRTPGVTASRTGGFGTTTGVRIRGAESDQTVVVIDGVKLNDPSAPGGGYDFGDLFVGDAAQIEVLRGPQSTLWGSQAIGGVVNIETALPKSGIQGSAQAEGGSRGTAGGKAAVGGSQNGISWQLAGNAFRTDGISAIAPEFGGHERDGYRHYGTSGRILAYVSDDVSLDLRGYWSHGKVGLDSSFGPPDVADYQKSTNWTGYAGVNFALFDGAFKNRLGVTHDQIDRDNIDPTIVGGDDRTFVAHGRNDHVEYQGSLVLAKGWNTVFGAEHEHSRFSAISPQYQTDPDHGNVSIDSVYGQVNGTLIEHLTVTGGVRYDHHQTYGGHALFSGGAVWSSGGTTIRASYGEGFKAPTLYQLYGRFGTSVFGNKDLKPETAQSYDVGVEQRLVGGRIIAGITWFHRDTTDQIDFGPAFSYVNIDRTRAKGVEFALSVRPSDRLTLSGSYSFIDSINLSPGFNFGNELARRPRQSVSASIDWKTPVGLGIGATVLSVGDSFDDAGNFSRLDGYTVVGLRADFPIGDKFSIYGRVDNLFDEKYTVVKYYSTPGRAAYGGIRLKFN